MHLLIGNSDHVYIPAGETHWHGAGPKSLLVHTAITIGGK